jgi:hypothetical protein
VTRIPFFSDVFTRYEFLLLFWNLHFTHVHIQDDPSRDRLIKPTVNAIREKCKLHYTPQATVSVDESTISFKGRISFKIYNPQKPTKFGMKIFVLSDSTNGYIYNFPPYAGKDTGPESDILKTTQIVTNLCSSLIKDTVPSNHPNCPPTMKHNVIIDYTKHMGGDDRSDHFIASYQFMRRIRKWYSKVFLLVAGSQCYKFIFAVCGSSE